MTKIYINSYEQNDANIHGIKTLSFDHMGVKVLSANRTDKIYGIFISQVMVAPSNFIRWDSFSIDTAATDNIWIYVRNADSNINSTHWTGPFKNMEESLDSMDKQLFQFMIVMSDNGLQSTQINSIELNFISSENSKLFFSKTFNIGFRAEHIILTYNADKSDDAILRFAVAGEETTDTSKYQYIEPNRIQELYSMPLYSDKIKLMMELAGDSGIPIKVHEISFMFSGEKYDRVNIETIISSSSSSSMSSSSSSFDSSSSESTMSTSSSSSIVKNESSLSSSSLSSSSSESSSSSQDDWDLNVVGINFSSPLFSHIGMLNGYRYFENLSGSIPFRCFYDPTVDGGKFVVKTVGGGLLQGKKNDGFNTVPNGTYQNLIFPAFPFTATLVDNNSSSSSSSP